LIHAASRKPSSEGVKKPTWDRIRSFDPSRIRRIGNKAFEIENAGAARIRVLTQPGRSVPFAVHSCAETTTIRFGDTQARGIYIIDVLGTAGQRMAEKVLLK